MVKEESSPGVRDGEGDGEREETEKVTEAPEALPDRALLEGTSRRMDWGRVRELE